MKEKSKNIIILVICTLIVIIGIVAILKYIKYGFVPLKGSKGEYTGYQLIINTTYGGHGIAGQDLGHGVKHDIYNVKAEDAFADGLFESIHLYDVDNSDEFESVILYIHELNDNYIGVSLKDGYKELEYNKEYELKSSFQAFDGVNYKYTIKFIKK